MDIVMTCPLGSECETIKDNKIHRCRWLTEIEGKNPNTGAEIKSKDCAIAYMPVLLINSANEIRKNVAATESFRNAVIAPPLHQQRVGHN